MSNVYKNEGAGLAQRWYDSQEGLDSIGGCGYNGVPLPHQPEAHQAHMQVPRIQWAGELKVENHSVTRPCGGCVCASLSVSLFHALLCGGCVCPSLSLLLLLSLFHALLGVK